MSLDRRNFLKTLSVAGLGLTVGKKNLQASTGPVSDTEFLSVLYDSTRCIGCQSCEFACSEQNDLNDPDGEPEIGVVRKTDEKHRTVVNCYDTSKGEVYVKTQCMHCNQPACDAACLTQAMHKTEEGPVIWRGDKCMGCRFCMVSCPFDIPKFEYHSANPKIEKCDMCFSQLKKGELPACVDNCPNEALVFGTRRELVKEARRRIHDNPDDYVDHIYGEHEAGGTSWLYLSPVPFDEIGFNTNIQMKSYPELSKGFLYSVPSVFVLWPTLLLGIHEATKDKPEETEEEEL
ncbi:MAG: 4Fe-4S dicluster domain-containing protein [Candidatus Marinimicrobia bacterium]|nr:4Fe-4S dicluster domain-containing protein [Candidatus Neomarinimicrobiota bacterium]